MAYSSIMGLVQANEPSWPRLNQTGFTLPELLVSLAVMAVLVSFAAPTVQNLMKDRQVTNTARVLHTSLLLARSVAVARASTVSLCKSLNGTTCNNGQDDWRSGWLVFADGDSNGEFDAVQDQLINVFEGSDELNILEWSRGDSLSFDSKGRLNVTNGTFNLCMNLTNEYEQRKIVVIGSGRARVLQVSGNGQCS